MTSLEPEMFEQTCRTCLSTNGEMVPIFSSDYYVDHIPKKLMAFTKVEITDDDSLPKVICKKCMFMADSFYCFKQQCEHADTRLKSFLRRGLNREILSERGQKLDSESRSDKTGPIPPALASKSSVLSIKKVRNEAKNVSERLREAEDDYTVEYISEEVRIEVEDALKRRQEAERRTSIEKVSESIKNLKGIEVVPIKDVPVLRNGRNSEAKKEEIDVFPVKVQKKRSKLIETIFVDDPPPINKRLRLPPETTVSKINGSVVKRENSMAHERCKKSNFSVVWKVVKIDEGKVGVEPKEENVKDSGKEPSRMKNDTDVIALGVDNYSQTSKSQFSEIRIEKEASEADSEKPDQVLLGNKILQEHPKPEDKHLKTAFQVSDVIPVYNQNIVHHDEDNRAQNIVIKSNLVEKGAKSNCYSLTAEEDVKILGGEDSGNSQRPKAANDSLNRHTVGESTIGCIFGGTGDRNVNGINRTEDDRTVENSNDNTDKIVDYRTEKSKEVFIENEASDGSNSRKTIKSIYSGTKDCFESSEIKREKGNENLNPDPISSENLETLNQATPLALLSVNSSGEENRTINLKIYQRNDSEGVEGTGEDNSSLKTESPVHIACRKLENTNLKFYQCTICSMNFVSMPAVLKHNIQEHMADEIPYLCLICDKSFQDKPSLRDHVEKHNGSKPYKCTFCPKTFTLQRNLKRHVNHHINYKPFECRICMKRFSEKSSLKSHMYLHTGNSPFACKSCNVSFNNKTNWRRHVMSIHEKLTVVVCKFCNKELPHKRALRVHIRIHTGDRPYQCPHCAKRFTQQCNLNTHIHCHLNDRPFRCPHCGKGFNQRGTRNDHVLTHTGEKRHKCTECDASFTVSSALKRHFWIHTDKERPYNCDKCKLQFVGLHDLRRHMKSRHGEIVRLENPRVERVVVGSDENKETENADVFGNTELVLNEAELREPSRDSECSRVEITAKENNSLSCNVNKFEAVQMEVTEKN